MNIEFQQIYTSYKTDKEVSDAMVQKCLGIVPEASDFFDSIRDRMTTYGKPFMILPAGVLMELAHWLKMTPCASNLAMKWIQVNFPRI